MTQDPLVHRIAEHLMKRDHRAPCVYDTAQEILQLVQEEGGIGDAIASSDGARPTSRTGTGANRAIDLPRLRVELERVANYLDLRGVGDGIAAVVDAIALIDALAPVASAERAA